MLTTLWLAPRAELHDEEMTMSDDAVPVRVWVNDFHTALLWVHALRCASGTAFGLTDTETSDLFERSKYRSPWRA